MNKQNTAIIFTDGASRGNPGPGGWGTVVISPERNGVNQESRITIQELGGREEHTTNNRMELQAAIQGLSLISNSEFPILVYSDSNYLINGITKWVFSWQKNNWRTSLKEEVQNRDLWQKLIGLAKSKNIEWRYVGGHAGIPGNERCDEIATAFADGGSPELFQGELKNYPIKNIRNAESSDSSVSELQVRHDKRVRSKAQAYSYVSMIDGVIKMHKSWSECEARVRGKKGAKYRKTLSKEEERTIVAEWKRA